MLAEAPGRRFAPLLVEKGPAPPLAGCSVFRGPECVGVVRSGGFGHRIGWAIAHACLEADCTLPGTRLEVEILGERRAAEVGQAPLYRRAG
ncbi:MAG: glycine cleavage T C-terminal barrel domain-containing protein [Acetobacteraceae bacterium]